MSSIVAIILRIWRKQFKCIYLKNPFSHDCIAFLDSTLNLEHFEKELQPHSLSISEIIHTEKSDYLNA